MAYSKSYKVKEMSLSRWLHIMRAPYNLGCKSKSDSQLRPTISDPRPCVCEKDGTSRPLILHIFQETLNWNSSCRWNVFLRTWDPLVDLWPSTQPGKTGFDSICWMKIIIEINNSFLIFWFIDIKFVLFFCCCCFYIFSELCLSIMNLVWSITVVSIFLDQHEI